jgi:myo-inositol 2-dehydrogenase/D-chiro-inositol 1-dehydrogenase
VVPRQLRVGLVGAGVMAAVHLANLIELGHRVSVYSEAGAAELVAGTPAVAVVDYDALLGDVDWVLIATPTDTHHDFAVRALQRGRDLIVEKPLARTYADAIALVELADSLGRRLLPGHVVRFFPEYVQLQRAVSSGALGSLAVLRFTRAGSFPIRSAWFADVARSGGIVFDQMLHDLDLARWLAGEVVSVSALSRHDESGPSPVQAAHVTLRHATGAITLASGVWGAQHLEFRTSFSVAGTGGILEHDSARERPSTAQLDRRPSDRLEAPDEFDDQPADGLLPARDAADDPYLTELAAFFDPVADPTRIVSARDGAEAVRIAEAALASLAAGQPIELSA